MAGYRDMNLYGTLCDGVSLKRVIGAEIETFELLEIVQRYQRITPDEKAEIIEKQLSGWKFLKPAKRESLEQAAGYYLAVSALAKERLQICSTVPDSATFKVEDMKIKAYSAEDTAAQYFLGESKLAFNGDAMVLKLEIKPDTAWNGTICLRIYNDKIEKKEDSAKMELYFDNIVLKETNA